MGYAVWMLMPDASICHLYFVKSEDWNVLFLPIISKSYFFDLPKRTTKSRRSRFSLQISLSAHLIAKSLSLRGALVFPTFRPPGDTTVRNVNGLSNSMCKCTLNFFQQDLVCCQSLNLLQTFRWCLTGSVTSLWPGLSVGLSHQSSCWLFPNFRCRVSFSIPHQERRQKCLVKG